MTITITGDMAGIRAFVGLVESRNREGVRTEEWSN